VLKLILACLAVVWLTACGASSLDGNNSPNALSLGKADLETGALPQPTASAEGKAAARMLADRVTKANVPGEQAYLIGPGDVVDVTVFNVPELAKTLAVSEVGTINFPLIGDTPAAGRTARQLEQELATKLGRKYLRDPQISVQVKEYKSQRVTVGGAVKKPGVYPIQSKLTLLQAIATAQGLQETAETTVLVFRSSNGKRSGAKFDIASVRSGQTPDPVLKAGDLIVANTSATQKAFESFLKVVPAARVFLLF